MKKTRIELEMNCTLCKVKFILWNLEEMIGKDVGSGILISNWKCFNCQSDLTFDIIRGKVPAGYEPEK